MNGQKKGHTSEVESPGEGEGRWHPHPHSGGQVGGYSGAPPGKYSLRMEGDGSGDGFLGLFGAFPNKAVQA